MPTEPDVARIVSQAIFTAAPFKSVPQDAAVAEVFGTLSVLVGITRMFSALTPSSFAAIMPHVCMNALAHFRAAVVHLHRAVLINQHQRAGLVQMRDREGNAEFHRRHRQAAFAMRIFRVPLSQFLAPFLEFARLFQFAARWPWMRLSSISCP